MFVARLVCAPGPLEYGYRSALYQSRVSVARLVFAPGPLVYGYKPALWLGYCALRPLEYGYRSALYQSCVSVAGLVCSTSPGIWVEECTVPVTSPVCLWLGSRSLGIWV